MDYRRYAAGHYARAAWVRCIECSTRERGLYVWQGNDREVNVTFQITAMMQHEIAKHDNKPYKPKA